VSGRVFAVPKLASIAQEVIDKKGTLVWDDAVVDPAPFVSVVPLGASVPPTALGVTFAAHHTVQVISDSVTDDTQLSPRVLLSAAQKDIVARYSILSLGVRDVVFPVSATCCALRIWNAMFSQMQIVCSWDAMDSEILQEIGSYLLPSEEAACVRVCRRWFDAFDGNPRWQAIFEAVFWSGSQVGHSLRCVDRAAILDVCVWTAGEFHGICELRLSSSVGSCTDAKSVGVWPRWIASEEPRDFVWGIRPSRRHAPVSLRWHSGLAAILADSGVCLFSTFDCHLKLVL
jgi:hypothetical protein